MIGPLDVGSPPDFDSLESRRLRGRLRQRLFQRPAAVTNLGRYRLGRMLGTGGMGCVYQAHDPKLDRRVAIKVLTAAPSEQTSRRLRREGRALAALCHPNIVPVFEIGLAGARPYVVMEHVDGGSLRDWARKGSHGFADKLDALLQAATGLAAAHAVGIVHCDVKPGNVLVGSDGRVRVADFGLAWHPLGGSRETTVSAVSTVSTTSTEDSSPRSTAGTGGTPGYIAPERLDGAKPDAVSDQFAWCVTAFEILWGERPLAGTRAIPSAAVGREQARVARVLLRGLRRDPRKRYPDLSTLLEALGRARRRARLRPWLAALFPCVAALFGPTPAPAQRTFDATEPAVPFDPRREQLRERIDTAARHRHRGRYAEAYATAILAAHDAARWDHPDLIPPAWVQLGLLIASERRGDVARSLLSDAYVEASRWGDDATAARAAAAMRHAAALEHDSSAPIWNRYAAAVASRAGDPSLSPAPRRPRQVVGSFGRDGDLGPEEAWVFAAPHAGTPGCSGHGCAHDLSIGHYDPETRAWITDDDRSLGRPVYALTAGEVIACWRGYPDHAQIGQSARTCWCHRTTGESRCDASPDGSSWTKCSQIVRGGGNVLVVLDEQGIGLNYVHLQAGSSPRHLCPNDDGRAVPEDFASREGFFPREYLTRPDRAKPRPRVHVGDLIGRTGQSGWAKTPRVHIQAVAYDRLDNGNFGQAELLELRFASGCFASLAPQAPWLPVREPSSLNELWLEHGPLALRPSCERRAHP